jgi:hypothetical protein
MAPTHTSSNAFDFNVRWTAVERLGSRAEHAQVVCGLVASFLELLYAAHNRPGLCCSAAFLQKAVSCKRLLCTMLAMPIMNKHLENFYRLTGLMRETPGPTGFKRESRWIMQEVPRE